MVMELDWLVGDESLDRSPLALPLTVPLTSDFTSFSLDGVGADAFVGEAMSIGSPGDGADIWIEGVGMGTILVMGSSGPAETSGFLCGLSVAAAICAVEKAWLAVASRSITWAGIVSNWVCERCRHCCYCDGFREVLQVGAILPSMRFSYVFFECEKGGKIVAYLMSPAPLSLAKVQASWCGY
jgi:hypothetical protein